MMYVLIKAVDFLLLKKQNHLCCIFHSVILSQNYRIHSDVIDLCNTYFNSIIHSTVELGNTQSICKRSLVLVPRV